VAIYLFFDESGNLDFSSNGSRWFCFGALTLRDPGPLSAAFSRVRYGLLAQGLELECFHAAEDRQVVRNQVFEALGCTGGFDFDVLVAEKCRTPAALRDPFEFYARLGYVLVDSVLDRYRHVDEPVVVVTDLLPLHRDRKALASGRRSATCGASGRSPSCTTPRRRTRGCRRWTTAPGPCSAGCGATSGRTGRSGRGSGASGRRLR
jgi:hypothetical protein